MSEALDKYLNLERVIVQLDDSGDEDAADALRPRAEMYWHQLTNAERAMLNSRDTAPKSIDRYRGSSALSAVSLTLGSHHRTTQPFRKRAYASVLIDVVSRPITENRSVRRAS